MTSPTVLISAATVRPGVRIAPADRARVESVVVPHARAEVATRRWLVRAVLADLVGAKPENLVIERACHRCGDASHGRPRLSGGPEFSAASAGPIAVVAVASCVVGVDVEQLEGLEADADRLGELVLTPEERNGYLSTPPNDRPGAFLKAWCRKEAVLKGSGVGIAGMADVDVSADQVAHDGRRWSLWSSDPDGGFALSVAVAGPPPTIECVRLSL